MKKYQTIFICFTVIAFLFGCQSQNSKEAGNKNESEITVVASFLPMYEFTKQVAGDRANVQLMVSEGQDTHHYEPSAQDVAAVSQADVFVYSSEEMEYWVKSLLNTVENNNLVIARAADGLDESKHDNVHDEHDSTGTEQVKINGVADHYHTGDDIQLSAELTGNADYDHWHWYQQLDESEEWEAISEQSTETLTMVAPDKSLNIRAVIYDDNHNKYAESEPVEINIDNHDNQVDTEHAEHNHSKKEAEINIKGLADHYHTGDVVTLEAVPTDSFNHNHWHWMMREDANQEWKAVPKQVTDHFEYKTTGKSFELKAVLYDDKHHIQAESNPVSVLIDDHEEQDPHIWLDPVLAQNQIKAIRDALIEADPGGEEIYEKNAESFMNELKDLDEEYQTTLKDAKNRVFVVQHQAFGHLAKRYNLEQIAIGGLSTEVEPSPSRIAEIGHLVEENNVPVIYYQQGASSSIAQTVASETGTDTAVLYDLEVLSDELLENNLGYIEAMRHNLKALQLSVH